MPFRELWGYELLFFWKKCFCETPYCQVLKTNTLLGVWYIFATKSGWAMLSPCTGSNPHRSSPCSRSHGRTSKPPRCSACCDTRTSPGPAKQTIEMKLGGFSLWPTLQSSIDEGWPWSGGCVVEDAEESAGDTIGEAEALWILGDMGTIAKLYEIKYAIVNVTTAVEVWEKMSLIILNIQKKFHLMIGGSP